MKHVDDLDLLVFATLGDELSVSSLHIGKLCRCMVHVHETFLPELRSRADLSRRNFHCIQTVLNAWNLALALGLLLECSWWKPMNPEIISSQPLPCVASGQIRFRAVVE